jgi:putative cell wall-binding protein
MPVSPRINRSNRSDRSGRSGRSLRLRRAEAGVAALIAIVVFGGIVSAGPASATVSLVGAGCPQGVAAEGFPIEPLEVKAPSVMRLTGGALPPGVLINTPGQVLFGEPSQLGDYRFRLQLDATQPDGSVVSSVANCSMTVQAAPTVNRIAGPDRYAQAIAVSSATFSSSELAYVATGEKFADALSTSAVGAWRHAPLLLTPKDSVPAGLVAELKRLGVKNVVVVGGKDAVSEGVAQSLAKGSGAPVTRIGGADRFEVSRALIGDSRFGMPKSTSMFVATGVDFPDALSAAPAAVQDGSPVLLVDGGATALTATESDFLLDFGVREATVTGGPLSFSDALLKNLTVRFAAERLSGGDRYETGAVVNHEVFKSASHVIVASGVNFPDALSGGVAAGVGHSPLYITTSGCLSPAVWFEIGRLAPTAVTVLGGTSALGPAIDTLEPCALD